MSALASADRQLRRVGPIGSVVLVSLFLKESNGRRVVRRVTVNRAISNEFFASSSENHAAEWRVEAVARCHDGGVADRTLIVGPRLGDRELPPSPPSHGYIIDQCQGSLNRPDQIGGSVRVNRA